MEPLGIRGCTGESKALQKRLFMYHKATNLYGHTLKLTLLCLFLSSLFPTQPLAAPISKEPILTYQGKTYYAGDTIYGYKNYVKLVVGDQGVPLLLGIPHDGALKGKPEIPRTSKSGRDIRTKPFVFRLAKLFKKDTGLQPWIIINEINRQRVDPNTYPNLADKRYGKKSQGRKTYDSYHALMRLARNAMLEQLGDKTGGLFIDIHGHGHRYADGHEEYFTSVIDGSQIASDRIRQSEIGYGLSNAALEKSDAAIDKYAAYAGIYALAKAHPNVPFSALIRGPYSLGALLDAEGTPAVPGSAIPKLERDAEKYGLDAEGKPNRRPYYNGGFLIRKYGTAQKTVGSTLGFNDNISALQIETPNITVRYNAVNMARSSHQYKRAIITYLNHWYGYSFKNSPYPYERF